MQSALPDGSAVLGLRSRIPQVPLMLYPRRGFNQVKGGDRFESAMTMTETHIVMGAGLFGDFNRLHVDEPFARASRHGGRIAHGYLTSSLIAASYGMVFHGTAIAYLEHACRFLKPVHAGDTLTTVWEITGLTPKPKHDGGIVAMKATCSNQDGEAVAEATGTMLVKNAG